MTGKPVARIFYKGEANAYITYQHIFSRGIDPADDEETAEEYTYGADIYSREDYQKLVAQVKSLLKNAGFEAIETGAETYEVATGFFHVPLTFKFYMEV